MPLILRVLATPANTRATEMTRSFSAQGGTLGRSLSNDWVLPDPFRYVSSKHARIDFEDGAYWLTDTSTNGVFINDAKHPMASGGRHRLDDGDRLRIGDYEIAVSVTTEAAAAVEPSTEGAAELFDDLDLVLDEEGDTPHQTTSPSLPKRAPAVEAGEDLLPPEALLDDPAPSGTGPVDAFGQRIHSPVKRERQPAPQPARPAPVDEAREARTIAIAPRARQPAAREPVAAPKPLPEPTPEELQALRMLLKGAGLDPRTLTGESATRVLQVAGQVLRETVLGLTEILQARTELKNVYRISQTTIQPGENNPLKFSAGVEEVLRKLFVEQGSRYLGPVEAIRDSFRDIKIHHLALLAATQKALREMLQRFEPNELQTKFDRGLKRSGLLGATNQMKYWDLYEEMFQVLCQHPPEQPVPHLFAEEFARAYEAEVERLRAVRRSRAAGEG